MKRLMTLMLISLLLLSACPAMGERLTLPEGLTGIQAGAFAGDISITEVYLPAGVTSIGAGAFEGCENLTDVYYPGLAVKIVFGENNAPLTGAVWHDTVTGTSYIYGSTDGIKWTFDTEGVLTLSGRDVSIPDYDIDASPWKDYPVKTLVIEEGIETIGGWAFRGYKDLTTVYIPRSLSKIYNAAFDECVNIQDVYYAGFVSDLGLMSIATTANKRLTDALWHFDFKGHVDGISFELTPDSVMTIRGRKMIDYGSKTTPWYPERSYIKRIVIEEGITTIGCWAFNEFGRLTSVSLPESLTSIRGASFANCTALTSFTIPDSVTYLGDKTFMNCTNLKSVEIGKGITSILLATFQNCNQLTSVTLPEGITEIGRSAFDGCAQLTSVTLPEGITKIEMNAFINCPIKEVFYAGSEADREAIDIGSGNESLINAHWNYAK